VGQLRLTVKYGRPYYFCQAPISDRKTDSIRAARPKLEKQATALANDLPFDGAFLFSNDPLADIGRTILELNAL
jgi:hypothetical protein